MFNEELYNQIYQRHYAQTLEEVRELRAQYESKVIIGKIKVSELFLKLKDSYDVTDMILYDTNQYDHALQTYEMMLNDGINDEDLLMAALVHDIGKVVPDEKPENIFCCNFAVNELPEENPRVDNLIFQFGHDEIAYQKLKAHCSPLVSFLIRYHSSRFTPEQTDILRESDPDNFKLLEHFLHYDSNSKSPTHKPDLDEDAIIRKIDEYFPEEIVY